jgi:hypothetical protein
MLVAGACSTGGQRLVEAFLALGAHVVAADGVRTRLEELRARLRQHERLWVAESDLGDETAALALFRDVGRDQPIDAAVLAIESAGELDVAGTDARRVRDALAGVARSAWFVRAVADASTAPALRDGASISAHGHQTVRALIVLEPARGSVDRAVAAALAELVAPGAGHAGPAVCGLAADLSGSAALERVVALCDPARAPGRGWSPAP